MKMLVIQFKENTKTHLYFIKANKKWLKPRLNFAYIATFIKLWNMKNMILFFKHLKWKTQQLVYQLMHKSKQKSKRIKVRGSNLARWNFWCCWRAIKERKHYKVHNDNGKEGSYRVALLHALACSCMLLHSSDLTLAC